jgi:hypothetical protein
MKIGIMTVWTTKNNYGCILQCYALQQYLLSIGHDAYLIRYVPAKSLLVKVKRVIQVSPFQLLRLIRLRISENHGRDNLKRRFNVFRNEFIKQSEKVYTYQDLIKTPPDADVYIVGSDQVWNFRRQSLDEVRYDTLRAYFLDFGDHHIKRIAYAASFGKENLNNEFIQEIAPILKKFDYISVREKSGLAICRQCGIDNAEWAPDPTMLLKPNQYRLLYSEVKIKTPSKPYCFIYMLRDNLNFSVKRACDWAKSRDLEVVFVPVDSFYKGCTRHFPTINEWLFLLDNADCVITDSFHASVFSLLFRKKFGVIPYSGVDVNSRFISLFDQFDIKPRFVDNDISIMDEDINWENVSSAFINIHRFYSVSRIKNIVPINQSQINRVTSL